MKLPSLPSLSPPRLFTRSRSLNRFPDNNLQQESPRPQSSKARQRAKSVSSKEEGQELLGVAFCSAEVEELPADFQLRRALKPLLNFKRTKSKDISNPYLFRGAPMVTTIVRSVGSHTKGVWSLIEKASRVGIRLAEMERPPLKKHYHIVQGGSPFMCTLLLQLVKAEVPPRRRRLGQRQPSYNWTRHWIHEACIQCPHPRRFPRLSTVSKVSGFDGCKRCHFECDGDWGFQVSVWFAWWTLETQRDCRCSARDSLHLRRGLSGTGERLRCPFSMR